MNRLKMYDYLYLGHILCNESSKSSAFLNHQISSAYAKWNEIKSVFLDKRIFLSTRVKFLEACVRSCLLYSVQAWQLGAKDMQKLESVWCGFLRRMVKGGFSGKMLQKIKSISRFQGKKLTGPIN